MVKKMVVGLSSLFRNSRQPHESHTPTSSSLQENIRIPNRRPDDSEDLEDVEIGEGVDGTHVGLLKDGLHVSEGRRDSNVSFQLRRPGPLWWRKLRHALASIVSIPPRPNAKPEGQSSSSILYFEPAVSRKSRLLRYLLYFALFFFVMLGIVKFISLLAGAIAAFFPEYLDMLLDSWGEEGQPTEGYASWPTDFSREIPPVPCHSHNDYWRKVPLFSALKAGCISVEADVWLYDDELYVGHTTTSLTQDRTLRNLYINPLLNILATQNPRTDFQPQSSGSQNGVFDTDPSQTLILLIDFKTAGHALWPVVSSQLEPLRSKGYLTSCNGTGVTEGPITVVATGNAPFDLVTANATHRDIFFDAPLDVMADPDPATLSSQDPNPNPEQDPNANSRDLGQGHTGLPPNLSTAFHPTNSYYASVSFKKSITHSPIFWPRLTSAQIEKIRAQIRGAHARGLKVRYWATPGWPRGLKEYVWRVLVREGVDILNVDDLEGATKGDWMGRKRKGWWGS